MKKMHAFTLLEVLFAVVLLSLVVTVCVPYMRSAPLSMVSGNLADFAASVDEEIDMLQRSEPNALTLEQIQEAVFPLGVTCESASEVDVLLHGQWITITNGTYTILRWAHVQKPEWADDQQETQAVWP